jgi:hypothetical protein
MKTKLTLSVDQNLIDNAKNYASAKDITVSELVARYFALIDEPMSEKARHMPKLTRELSGVLKTQSQPVSEEDYGKYLEDKVV